MKLHILGSGSCVPYKRRGSSGYGLTLQESTVLLDCGNGSTWKLGEAGINYLDVDHIFISHIHPDHTADLIPFLFATRYAYGSPYGSERTKPLTLYGARGFKRFFSALQEAYGIWIVPQCLKIEELGEGTLRFDDFSLTAAKVPHIESSLAFRIESGGKSIVYSGDTDYSESLIGLAKNADALIIECALPDDESKLEGHLTPTEAAEIGNKSGAKRLIITHLYPICDEKNVAVKIREKVSSEVILAEDLMEIDI